MRQSAAYAGDCSPRRVALLYLSQPLICLGCCALRACTRPAFYRVGAARVTSGTRPLQTKRQLCRQFQFSFTASCEPLPLGCVCANSHGDCATLLTHPRTSWPQPDLALRSIERLICSGSRIHEQEEVSYMCICTPIERAATEKYRRAHLAELHSAWIAPHKTQVRVRLDALASLSIRYCMLLWGHFKFAFHTLLA